MHYWHLLSLDAPTVAAVWVLTFNPGLTTRQNILLAATLALAVWLIYVADRLMDALHGSGKLEARHTFHARHARSFGIAALIAAALLAVLLVQAIPAVRLGWLGLCLPLTLYAAAVHGRGKGLLRKEPIVAVMFAAATALPAALASMRLVQLGVVAGLFALVCWLNCTAIVRWERGTTTDAATWTTLRFRVACFLVAAASLASARTAPALPALACALAALCLCVLDRVRWRVKPLTLRALADLSLLSPLLLWPLLR